MVYHSGAPGVTPGFLVGLCFWFFSFLSCVVFLCFICLRPVACVPTSVDSISVMSILNCPFGFLKRLSYKIAVVGQLKTSINSYSGVYPCYLFNLLSTWYGTR